MEAGFSSLLERAERSVSYQNQEVIEGRRLVIGANVVINLLLGILWGAMKLPCIYLIDFYPYNLEARRSELQFSLPKYLKLKGKQFLVGRKWHSAERLLLTFDLLVCFIFRMGKISA